MLKKLAAKVVKPLLVALNKLSCKTYKKVYPQYLKWCGVDVEHDYLRGGFDPWISPSAYFDPGYPGLIKIGRGTTVSFEACFLAHDYSLDKELYGRTGEHGLIVSEIEVGRNCFIGARAMLLPGTRLGDGCIVGANAVVKGSYAAGSVLAGNPARLLGTVESMVDRHMAKGDISFWRGSNCDYLDLVLAEPKPFVAASRNNDDGCTEIQ